MNFNDEYKFWITSIKERIRTSQIKAAIKVNEELIALYWDIGKSIVQKQEQSQWGTKLIEQVAKDLKYELPDTNGFSRTNLFNMRQFYLFYAKSEIVRQTGGQTKATELIQQPVGQFSPTEFVQQAAGQFLKDSILTQVPWGHHIIIINKTISFEAAFFYINKTIENNWSRNVLQIQIESKLFEKQGKAINNFALTLPLPQSDLARETLKDPYKFDFLTLENELKKFTTESKL